MDNSIIRFAFAAMVLPMALIVAPKAQASLYGSGGTETLLDNDTVAVHTFTNNGTFTLSEDWRLDGMRWQAWLHPYSPLTTNPSTRHHPHRCGGCGKWVTWCTIQP